MIVGLCGRKNAGKDTVAAYLMKEYQFERRAFADSLKRSVAALFDIDPTAIERLKNDDGAVISLVGFGSRYPNKEVSVGMTFRHFLQRYGTESHRDVFGPNFWVDQILPVGAFYSGRKIVVTDVRFDSEVDRIHELGGHVVLIDRPQANDVDDHSSEQPEKLEHDIVIQNDSTLESLHKATRDMLDWLVD